MHSHVSYITGTVALPKYMHEYEGHISFTTFTPQIKKMSVHKYISLVGIFYYNAHQKQPSRL